VGDKAEKAKARFVAWRARNRSSAPHYTCAWLVAY
jgi:hypothetical protein